MNTVKVDLNFLALEGAELAKKAGEIICQIYKENTQALKKKDGSYVTQADQQSHVFLKEGLTQLTPHIPVISEEDENSWDLKSPFYWLVDPLDGTKGFINKTGEFCINIALMKDHYPILGIIHIPLTGETFYGYERKAIRQYQGKKKILHSRPPSSNMTLILGGYGKKYKKQEDFFLKAYPIANVERIRSAIKFTLIASGKADLYIRFEACREWDTAAGQAIVEAAGGLMTNLDGSPFLYGKPGLVNAAFAVFGKKP